MKFIKFNRYIMWKFFFIIPAILISINEPMDIKPNLHISIHWLGFHASWLWRKEQE